MKTIPKYIAQFINTILIIYSFEDYKKLKFNRVLNFFLASTEIGI